MAGRFVTFTALSVLDPFIQTLYVYVTYLSNFGQERTKDIHKFSKQKILSVKRL